MRDGEIRSSHLQRRRPVHATSGVLDETGQEPAVVDAEQAVPVTNGYAWSGRMRATGDVPWRGVGFVRRRLEPTGGGPTSTVGHDLAGAVLLEG
jgi:hypothetical protein